MEKLYPTGPIRNLMKQVSSLREFRSRNQSRFETLTDREKEVLTLVAEGMKNADIAAKLDISTTTVQNHRSHLRDKLGITSQAAYVKIALAFDLIRF